MKPILSLLLFLCMMLGSLQAQAYEPDDFKIEGVGTATQGHYLVKVSVFTKNAKLPDRDLALAGVYGVLFHGFADANGLHAEKPLAGGPGNFVEHRQFYDDFFGPKGLAADYATVIDGTRSVTKTGKLHRVSVTMSVSKDELRKYLEENDIIQGLNSIF